MADDSLTPTPPLSCADPDRAAKRTVGLIRLVIADDHPLFRDSLACALRQREEFEVVGIAASAEEALTSISQQQPDIALLDVLMPGGGIEATRTIRSSYPNTLVVMLSAYGHAHYVAASLRAGAAGYITKTATVEYLCAALKMIYHGEIVCDYSAHGLHESTPQQYWPGTSRDSNQQGAKLNPRELTIMGEVARGLGNRAIAAKLGISDRTVQAHLANAFGKLGVHTRTAAVMRCVSSGLLQAETELEKE